MNTCLINEFVVLDPGHLLMEPNVLNLNLNEQQFELFDI